MSKLPLTRRRVICATCGKVALLEPGEERTDRYAGLHTCYRLTDCACVCLYAEPNQPPCPFCNSTGRLPLPMDAKTQERIEDELNRRDR